MSRVTSSSSKSSSNMSSSVVKDNDLEGNLSEALLPKITAKSSPNSNSSKHEPSSKKIRGSTAQAVMGMCVLVVGLHAVMAHYCCHRNDETTDFAFELILGSENDPLDFDGLFHEDIDAENTSIVNVAAELEALTGPIPPFHPHHTAFVTYSSHPSSDGRSAAVEYRRDIRAPCNYGMFVFSVGPARDNLPYRYNVYNEAYLFSDNNGLCILDPWFTGYQVSQEPFWNPTDPMSIKFKNLNKNTMHWISSRLVNPHNSKRKYDRQKTGDYVVIAKHDFYNAAYYRGLKETVNQWK